MLHDTHIESIFLTGGTGYLGTHLRTALATEEVDVTVLSRDRDAVDPRPNESVVEGDLTDPGSFSVPDTDGVIHLAAQTSVADAIESPRETWQVNADGTLNLLELFRGKSISTFLYVSSMSVYGPPEFLPVTEAHPLNPVEPYGASKAAGDRLAHCYERAFDVPTVVARLFNTYGLGQPAHNVVPAILGQALEQDTVELGNLSPTRDFLHVSDAVDALLTLLEQGVPGDTYNVGRGEETQIGTLAETILELVNREADIVPTPDRMRDEGIEIPRVVCDSSKIRALGWEPAYDLRTGLRRMVDAYDERE